MAVNVSNLNQSINQSKYNSWMDPSDGNLTRLSHDGGLKLFLGMQLLNIRCKLVLERKPPFNSERRLASKVP